MNPLKILYVEDDPAARDSLQRGLTAAGQQVFVAADAPDGLALARAEYPDVVLIDVLLGELDGLMLALQLRASPGLENTILLALSAADEGTHKPSALAAGCIDYLIKGIPPSELIEIVRGYVRERRQPPSDGATLAQLRRDAAHLVDELQRRIVQRDAHLAELRRTQERLVRTEQLAAAGRLGLALAHELNNPLQTVQSALELLLDNLPVSPGEQEWHQYANVALKEARRASEVVSSLLSVQTLSVESNALVDWGEVIQDVVNELRPAAETVRISIELTVPATASHRVVQAVYGQLHVIMRNLIQNAIDAMSDRGGQVRVHAARTLYELVIEVSDNGPGIPPGARLAEPFYTTRPSGHGLGLYICTLIARVYQAQLEWFNQPSGGATFRLHWPIPLTTDKSSEAHSPP
ncbi:MAG: hybrid sensor histidine kinase/response regulator [Aggregatilineales bacterium]